MTIVSIVHSIFHSTIPFHIPVQRLETPLLEGSEEILSHCSQPSRKFQHAVTTLCACHGCSPSIGPIWRRHGSHGWEKKWSGWNRTGGYGPEILLVWSHIWRMVFETYLVLDHSLFPFLHTTLNCSLKITDLVTMATNTWTSHTNHGMNHGYFVVSYLQRYPPPY